MSTAERPLIKDGHRVSVSRGQHRVWSVICLLCGLLIACITFFEGIDPINRTYDSSPESFFIFVLAYILIGSIFLPRYLKESNDLFSPLPALFILLFLYSAASALFVRGRGVTLFGDSVSMVASNRFYICSVCGAFALSLGAVQARIRKERRKFAFGRRLISLTEQRFLFACILIGAVSIVVFLRSALPRFDFLHVASYADTALSSRADRMGEASAGIDEVFRVYVPVVTILSGSIILTFGNYGRIAKIIGLSILGCYIVTNTLGGARRSVVEVLVMIAVYFHYRVRKVRWSEAFVGSVFLYLFVNLLSVARVSSSPTLMLDAISEHWQDVGASTLALTSSGELLTGINLHRLIDGLHRGETEYTYGTSELQEALVFVPKVIYPTRPLPLAQRFVDVFYPGVREEGGGYGFFILQEGYWAAGLPGVILSMLIMGYVVEWIYLQFRASTCSSFSCFVYAAIYSALIVGSVRSGIVSSFKTAFLLCIPILMARFAVEILPHQSRAAQKRQRVDRDA